MEIDTSEKLKDLLGDPNKFAQIRLRFGVRAEKTINVSGDQVKLIESVLRIIDQRTGRVVDQAFGHVEPDGQKST